MMGHLERLGSWRDEEERCPVAGLRIALPLSLALWAAIAAGCLYLLG